MIGKSFMLLVIVLSASLAFAADRITSPDKSLIAIIEPFLKSNGNAAENFISIIRADGDPLVEIDFRSHNADHGIQGQIVDKVQWTSDSNFLVLSTNSTGNQPRFSNIFFYARKDNHLRRIDTIIGRPVVDSNFIIVNPDTLIIFVRDDKTGAGKELSVNLSNLMKKKI
jgi:hypothetical protein